MISREGHNDEESQEPSIACSTRRRCCFVPHHFDLASSLGGSGSRGCPQNCSGQASAKCNGITVTVQAIRQFVGLNRRSGRFLAAVANSESGGATADEHGNSSFAVAP